MVNEIVDIPLEMGNTPLDTVIKRYFGQAFRSDQSNKRDGRTSTYR